MPQGTPKPKSLKVLRQRLSALERRLSRTQDPEDRKIILRDIHVDSGILQRQILEHERRAARTTTPERVQRDSTLQERVRARRSAERAAGLQRGKP